jgi:hypothetical protein
MGTCKTRKQLNSPNLNGRKFERPLGGWEGTAILTMSSMESTNESSLNSVCPGKSTTAITGGATSQILKPVYVMYKDHVFFRNVEAPTAQAVIRETLGWIKEETEDTLLIECDRPLLECRRGFNGVVIIKSCIISLVRLNLNCQIANKKSEYCALAKEAKNSAPTFRKERKNL